jgi:hypothetical protein
MRVGLDTKTSQPKVRPSHGFIVCVDGTWHRVENDAELRAWVFDLVGRIPAAKAAVNEPIPVNPKPDQCRPCGMGGLAGRHGLTPLVPAEGGERVASGTEGREMAVMEKRQNKANCSGVCHCQIRIYDEIARSLTRAMAAGGTSEISTFLYQTSVQYL